MTRRLVLAALAVAFVAPLAWMVAVSLQPPGRGLVNGFAFPDGVHPENYLAALRTMEGFPRMLLNTVFVTVLSVAGQVFCCGLAGYALAVLRFPGRDALFLLVLATMMLPPQVLAVPQFMEWRALGAVDTFWPLVLPTWLGGAPFFVFLFRQFFLTVPRSLVDAARLDGCGHLAVFTRVLLPLARPAVGAVAVFTFLAAWNDYWAPLLYLNRAEHQTLTLGLAAFTQMTRVEVELLLAATSIVLAPCLIVFFLAQRWFLQGVRLQAGKG